MPHTIQAVIPLFPQFTALDGIGPYEVLQRLPEIDVDVHRPRARRGAHRQRLPRHHTRRDVRGVPDARLVVFPGGVGTRALMHDERVLDWVRTAHETTTFTTSVCTGSLVLGAAGLLDGLTATTHWAATRSWRRPAPRRRSERVVEHLDRRIITAAGVSSGIDMALRLVEILVDRTAAEASQLMIEYDPQPPFDAGAVGKAGEDVMERVTEYAAARK